MVIYLKELVPEARLELAQGCPRGILSQNPQVSLSPQGVAIYSNGLLKFFDICINRCNYMINSPIDDFSQGFCG